MLCSALSSSGSPKRPILNIPILDPDHVHFVGFVHKTVRYICGLWVPSSHVQRTKKLFRIFNQNLDLFIRLLCYHINENKNKIMVQCYFVSEYANLNVWWYDCCVEKYTISYHRQSIICWWVSSQTIDL